MTGTGRKQINKYEMLLAAVIIARATSLLIVKASLAGFSIFNLMALRFAIAFVCITPFVIRHAAGINKKTLLHGTLLGIIFFAVIAVELLALRMTGSASEVSFLENTSIIIVPIVAAFLKRIRPELKIITAALTAMCGVGFLLTKDGHIELTAGTVLCILTAVLYSAYVIITDKVSKQDDPLVLGTVQLGVVAVMSGLVSALIETPRLPQNSGEWIGLILIAVICSSIGTALQPVAQSRVTAEKSGLFCALNPLTACTLGWIFLGEWQGMSGVAGAVLILAAIFISGMKDEGNIMREKWRHSASYTSAEKAIQQVDLLVGK